MFDTKDKKQTDTCMNNICVLSTNYCDGTDNNKQVMETTKQTLLHRYSTDDVATRDKELGRLPLLTDEYFIPSDHIILVSEKKPTSTAMISSFLSLQ